jgi:hypothetical protein
MQYYSNDGESTNDIFRPSTSDVYAFILNNRTSVDDYSTTKSVDVTLIHSWQLEIRESRLKDKP